MTLRHIIAILVGVLGGHTDSYAEVYPVTLDRMIIQKLGELGCSQTGQVAQASAYSLFKNSKQAQYADVRCRPHSNYSGRPLYQVTQCVITQGEWNCSPAENEFTLAVGAREVAFRPGQLSIDRAYKTAQKISGYGFFQGISVQDALQSPCNMGMGEKPELIEVSCKNWLVSISYWCPQKGPCPRVIYMQARD